MRELRMRRLDRHSFVIELSSPSGKRSEICGYYSNLRALSLAALEIGVEGNTGSELLASVEESEKRVLAALKKAVETGAFTLSATGRGSGATGRPSAGTGGKTPRVAGATPQWARGSAQKRRRKKTRVQGGQKPDGRQGPSTEGGRIVEDRPLLVAALWYARHGVPVFPCHSIEEHGRSSCHFESCSSPGKHPRTLNGVSDAPTYADHVRRWWGMFPVSRLGGRPRSEPSGISG